MFRVTFDDASTVIAHRLILATGVRDVMPDIENLADHFGSTVFTCPSCDAYESRGKAVVVFGFSEFVAGFAIGLLDWAISVTVVTNGQHFEGGPRCRDALQRNNIELIEDDVTMLEGEPGTLRAAVLRTGRRVPCEIGFVNIGHEHRDDLFLQLGCALRDDGCIDVDHDQQTTVTGVYAAGDISPGPHLIQVAAAQGAIAGLAAAQSMRGEAAAAGAPTPAPDPTTELVGS